MSCSVCKHSELYNEGNDQSGNAPKYQCKRFPPVPIPVPTFDRLSNQQGIGIQPVWPIMRGDDHCGEFAAGEDAH